VNDQEEYWENFWEDQNEPLHARSTDEYYAEFSVELLWLLQGRESGRVLELGCGSGEFYDRLGFSSAKSYLGTDLSASMLEAFEARHPGVQLQKASAHQFSDDQQFDLIYSNGVMQNLSVDMLRSHFELAAGMLSPDGLIVDASIPWAVHKYPYRAGNLKPPYRFSIRPAASWALTAMKLRRDQLGYWYTPKDLDDSASEFGLVGEFRGSISYPYRFHALFHKAPAS